MTHDEGVFFDFVFAGTLGGCIGLAPCPGSPHFLEDQKTISLTRDLQLIKDWGARDLVTLNETWELESVGITHIGQQCQQLGIRWHHLPIEDMEAPDFFFETEWETTGPLLIDTLAHGGKIMIHCWAGLGRTGTIAVRLLAEMGASVETALNLVRRVRPGSVQSINQENYLRQTLPGLLK